MERDPVFREELLKEGIDCLLTGDVDTGKAILRDYINNCEISCYLQFGDAFPVETAYSFF